MRTAQSQLLQKLLGTLGKELFLDVRQGIFDLLAHLLHLFSYLRIGLGILFGRKLSKRKSLKGLVIILISSAACQSLDQFQIRLQLGDVDRGSPGSLRCSQVLLCHRQSPRHQPPGLLLQGMDPVGLQKFFLRLHPVGLQTSLQPFPGPGIADGKFIDPQDQILQPPVCLARGIGLHKGGKVLPALAILLLNKVTQYISFQ